MSLFFLHIRRHKSLEKVAVSGYIAGKRTPGRQRLKYSKRTNFETIGISTEGEYI